MNPDTAEELAERASDLTHNHIEVRDDYSGRGMYGAQTIAFVGPPDMVAAIAYAAAEMDLPYDDVPARTDQMGRDNIVLY